MSQDDNTFQGNEEPGNMVSSDHESSSDVLAGEMAEEGIEIIVDLE